MEVQPPIPPSGPSFHGFSPCRLKATSSFAVSHSESLSLGLTFKTHLTTSQRPVSSLLCPSASLPGSLQHPPLPSDRRIFGTAVRWILSDYEPYLFISLLRTLQSCPPHLGEKQQLCSSCRSFRLLVCISPHLLSSPVLSH